MANSKKWSEQILIEESFKTHENGKEVIREEHVLQVCMGGKDLYRKNFIEGKYKGKNKLIVPFDFILLAGDLCTEGKFYEMEYFIGEKGMVYRALIQAVNPCIDLPQMLGALKQRNILPDGFNPRKAWLRSDIDAVSIGNCIKDENGEPIFFCGHKAAKDSDINVTEYTAQYKSACLEYYRGDVREVWTEPGRCFRAVFVCGSDNVNDPAFAQQRAKDMEDMQLNIQEAIQIAKDYNIAYLSIFEKGTDETGTPIFDVSTNFTKEAITKIAQAITSNPE